MTLAYRTMLLALVCALLAGCASTQQATTESNPITDEFAASPDRAPTEATLLSMANILTARGQDDQAAYVYRRVIREYPSSSAAYNGLAELQMRHDDPAGAAATLDTGLAVAPDNARLHNNRGMAAMILGEYDAAIEQFDRAIELSPRSVRYHNNKATAAGLKGDYDAALAGFMATLSEADAHRNLALIADARGDHDRAALERSLALPPK